MKYSDTGLTLCAALLLSATSPASGEETTLFTDDFDGTLAQWELLQPDHITIVEEPGSSNRVVQLKPKTHHFVHALMRGTESAGHVRLEGRMLFPTDGDGYLGLIYNYQTHDGRADFGVIYFKSNGSYVRISPHYDGNPSWRLHEEMKVALDGPRRIEVGRWYSFRLDVAGQTATLYLDDFSKPLVSYSLFEQTSGQLGLEARPGKGEPVWVDQVRVTSLPDNYVAPPASNYPQNDQLITRWEAAGPFVPSEAGNGKELPARLQQADWHEFQPDARGMVRSGRMTEYLGDRYVAWFRHSFEFQPGTGQTPMLHLSTANPISIWLNGQWVADVPPQDYTWPDFLSVDEHNGTEISLVTAAGQNTLLLRVDGNIFAAGGFYAGMTAGE